MRVREAVTRVLSLTIEKRSRAMQVKGNITCAQLAGTSMSAQWNYMALQVFERPLRRERLGRVTAGILGEQCESCSMLRTSWADWLSIFKHNPLSGWRLVKDDFSRREQITIEAASVTNFHPSLLLCDGLEQPQSDLYNDSRQTSPKHRPTIMAKIQVCNVIRNLCNTALQLGGAGRPDQ
jgi:hypothetical protein